MKGSIKQRFLLGVLLFVALFSLVPTSVFALSNAVYLTPASGSSRPGSTFTVSVDGSVGSAIFFGTYNVQGTVTFPANLLKVASVNTSGSTFYDTNIVTPDNSAGTISFNQGNWLAGANNQTVHLFTITFQALANGTANVGFKNVSYSTGSAIMTGGTYSISTPATSPSPSPTPSPTTSASPRPTSSVQPTTTPATTVIIDPTPEETIAPTTSSDGGLKIENVKTTTTRQQNSVNWTMSSDDVNTKFMYGTTKGSQKTEATATKKEDGTYDVSLSGLKLGTLYYFTIKASTSDELQGATYNGSFTTRGYPVQLTIQQNGTLAAGAKVKIGDRSFTANKDALVATELGDGSYNAAISLAGSSESHSIEFTVAKKTIPASGSPPTQLFTLNAIATSGSAASAGSDEQPVMAIVVGSVAAGVIGIAGVSGFLFYRKKRQQTDTAIDSDLLATSYGPALQDYRTQTPTPNLDVHSVDTLPLPPAPYPDEQAPPQVIESSPAYQLQELPPLDAPIPDTPPVENYPAPEPQQAIEAIPPTPAPQAATVPHDEGDNNKAVYHPETGELEILHGSHGQMAGGMQ